MESDSRGDDLSDGLELVWCWRCGRVYPDSMPIGDKPCPDCVERSRLLELMKRGPADGLLVLYGLGVDERTLMPLFPYIRANPPIAGTFSEPERLDY